MNKKGMHITKVLPMVGLDVGLQSAEVRSSTLVLAGGYEFGFFVVNFHL